MMKWLRTRLSVLVVLAVTVALLAGCGGAKKEAPAPAAAPAAAPAPACPECPKVDEAKIVADGLKAAAVKYYSPLPSDSNNIKAPDVQKMIDAKQDFFGVDIRSAADFAKGHLPGFVNIPFAEVGKNLDKFPKDKLIIVQCYTGQTASQTVGVLRMLGYNAKNLHFGFQGVTDNKLPTVQ
ncbi:MAG TPA: rhodanese-like domain-containing protein [Symbiobacteriaceae bacterium]|nr:rhodanese-like domain-containing protein [Symbiobacteriaceae bacterium]